MTFRASGLAARSSAPWIVLLAAVLGGLTACGGGGDSSGIAMPKLYTVGGSTSGLVGTGLALQDNGGASLAIAANGAFAFDTALASGSAYAVTVQTQPTDPNQTCVISGGSGTVAAADISNVEVTCTTSSFTVGGSLSGLQGSGLVLQDNLGDNLTPSGNGNFTFATPVASGAPFAITVRTQPSNPAQTCSVSNGTGTVGTANVTAVQVKCNLNVYSINGQVTGLAGSGLVLQDNAGDNLAVASSAFSFPTLIISGGSYDVTVLTQPSNPAQICTVSNATGSVVAANISNVQVSCTSTGRLLYVTNSYDGANGSVSAFTINSATGALSAVTGSPFAADVHPAGIALDPTGEYLYVANIDSADVSSYTVNTTTGVLTGPVNVPTGSASNKPYAVGMDPLGKYVYVGSDNVAAQGSVESFYLSPLTGDLSAGTSSPFLTGNTPFGLAVDPGRAFVYATAFYDNQIHGYALNTATGALSELSNSPFMAGSAPSGIAISPLGGFLYATNNGNGTISAYAYDTTGSLTALAGSPYAVGSGAGSQPLGLAIDRSGKLLYVSDGGDGTVSAFTISAGTGALSAVAGSPFPTGSGAASGPSAVVIDPTDQFVYVANAQDGTVSVFAVTATTGALTAIATYPTGLGSQHTALAIE